MDKEIEALLVPNQKAITLLRSVATIGSLAVAAIGILCLLGWQFNIDLFKNFFPHVVAMNPLSAVGFVCAGTALFLQLKKGSSVINTWSVITLILICVTIFIGLTTTLPYISTIHIGLNTLLFAEKLAGNSISPNTSASFLAIGIALLFSQFPLTRYFSRIAQILTLFIAILSMFAIIGYSYQAFSFYSVAPFAPMPLSSALTFAILCLALLAAISNHGFIKILTKNTPSSLLALRLILITLTLPAILGYLLLLGEQLHFFDIQTGISLLVIGTILLFSTIVWVNTRLLQKQELENLIIKNELEKENIKLKIDSKQLAAKAMELEEKKEETYEYLMKGNLYQPPKPQETGD